MHLAAMMGLVIKEMEHRRRRCFHVILALAVCVTNRPVEKIAVDVVEEGFDARVLFDPRCAEAGELLEQYGIQWWCRLASPGKP
jgi:hypothetical protein